MSPMAYGVKAQQVSRATLSHVTYAARCQSVSPSDVDPTLAPQLARPVSGTSIGERIAAIRKSRGLSKSELARKLWPDQEPPRYRMIHRWEDEGKVPEPESLRRLAEVLGVTIEELMGVAAGQDPPFEAWPKFLETDEAKAMTDNQRRALAGFWWGDREPTVASYKAMLLAFAVSTPKTA